MILFRKTIFGRKAINFFNLRTEFILIDPYPRAEIDNLNGYY